jgi:hypothetical protein
MNSLYQTDDSLKLKEGAQNLMDRFLIIGMNLIEQKKFKK